jgi:CheY-like chemotaxis protein
MAKRVLVVDDHGPTRLLIRTLLEREKAIQFDVVEAATGTDCLKAHAHQGPFDLILLDVNLPDMEATICRRLRSVDDAVPIVFVTASDPRTTLRAWRGGDSYLVVNLKSNRAARGNLNLFVGPARDAAVTAHAPTPPANGAPATAVVRGTPGAQRWRLLQGSGPQGQPAAPGRISSGACAVPDVLLVSQALAGRWLRVRSAARSRRRILVLCARGRSAGSRRRQCRRP